MITLEQFQAMAKGTIFYIAAGGKANNLVVDRFLTVKDVSVSIEPCSVEKEYRPFILTYSGAMCYTNHLLLGVCCYLTKEEAEEHMLDRAQRKHILAKGRLEKRIVELQQELADYEKSPAKVDYVFLDFSYRTDAPIGGIYD